MRKTLIFLLCFLIFSFSFLSIIAQADTDICTVTVATVKGNVGDTVYVPISISNNPGISGFTITITYNSKALKYVSYTKGAAFTDNFMLKEHPDKNYIKIAGVERTKDSTNNGDILTLKFSIAKDATAELHKIDVEYKKGNFANRKLESIEHKIISGGIDVAYSPEAKNCPHKTYGKWEVVSNPTCTNKGAEQRICTVCGHRDTRETATIDHVYEDKWTIDTPATAEKDGVMTRHCKHCIATTDKITFPFKDTQKEDIDNSVGTEVPKNDYTENLYNEQYPDKKPTQTVSSAVVSSKNSTSSAIVSEEKDDNNISSEETVISSEDTTVSQTDAELEPESDNKELLIISAIILLVILVAIIAIVACKKTV